MKLQSKNITKWLRIIHRDLGFLMVGVCLVYGISGFLLNHMNGKDPAFKTVQEVIRLNPNLSTTDLKAEVESNGLPNVKRVMPIDADHQRILFEGGIGVYNQANGVLDYELHKRRAFVYWINKLHYNKINGWSFMGDFFAISLVFFAISGLFMVKGKKGIKGRGKWYLLVGLAIPVVYIILS